MPKPSPIHHIAIQENSIIFFPLKLNFINFGGFDNGVSLGNGLTAGGLVVKSAIMLVGIPVLRAEHVPATALETRQPHTLVAPKTSVTLPCTRLLRFLFFSCFNGGRAGRPRVLDSRRRQRLRNRRLRSVKREWLVVTVKQKHLSVTLGTQVHGGRASEEATVIDAVNGPFRHLTPTPFLLHL
eukprot:Gb_31192 [translate_table: standard]